MRKPEHQWETSLARARRRTEVPPAWADRPHAQAFALEFRDGRVGQVVFATDGQHLDAIAAKDPGVVLAARCWVAARGGRSLALDGPEGPLDHESFGIEDLVPSARGVRGTLITLAPSNAEIVHALGAFHRVIACEDSSDHPPRTGEIERLGPDLGPNLDRVADLAPALVVSSLSVPGMERIVTGLAVRGVPQIVLAPRGLHDVQRDVERVATAIDCTDAGRAVVAQMAAERDALLASSPKVPTPVYLEWWPKPMFTPGRDCYSNELIELAGGANVFRDRPASSVEIEPGELLAADPDVCFVSWCGVAEAKLNPQNLVQRPGLERLRAAREGRVFALDEQFSGRPGPRMLEAARRMARAIQGET